MRRESGADGREAGGGFLSVTTYVSVVVCIDGTRALFRSAGPSGHRGFVVALYSLDPADLARVCLAARNVLNSQ